MIVHKKLQVVIGTLGCRMCFMYLFKTPAGRNIQPKCQADGHTILP